MYYTPYYFPHYVYCIEKAAEVNYAFLNQFRAIFTIFSTKNGQREQSPKISMINANNTATILIIVRKVRFTIRRINQVPPHKTIYGDFLFYIILNRTSWIFLEFLRNS